MKNSSIDLYCEAELKSLSLDSLIAPIHILDFTHDINVVGFLFVTLLSFLLSVGYPSSVAKVEVERRAIFDEKLWLENN